MQCVKTTRLNQVKHAQFRTLNITGCP